ncbi:shikimate kinase [Lacrimispora sp.]|jgi:shikimate kinase|uniref:shikimate kinase n=1 Tax=Lacrimispora sp. TaxID=2719234 RepID=UPI00289E640B|nr:shikimate kinase [Lacrimispora sp.]
MRELNEIKKDLNCCDQEILDLLKQRLGYAAEIMEYKKEQGLPIFLPEEEKIRHEDLLAAIGDHAYCDELLSIFKQIHEESKCVQTKSLFGHNIALIGFMGTGKSTVSKYLRNMLAMKEVDVDAMIVEDQKMPIRDIFEKYGEEYFRDCESNAILNLRNCRQTIISCGGGAVMREENVKNLKKGSRIILLTARPETILARVKDDGGRPILNGNMNVEFIKELMAKRKDFYEKAADIIVETDHKSVQQICEELVVSLM